MSDLGCLYDGNDPNDVTCSEFLGRGIGCHRTKCQGWNCCCDLHHWSCKGLGCKSCAGKSRGVVLLCNRIRELGGKS